MLRLKTILGPILLITDTAPENQQAGAVISIVLLIMIFSVAFKPREITGVVSAVGTILWIVVGFYSSFINV